MGYNSVADIIDLSSFV